MAELVEMHIYTLEKIIVVPLQISPKGMLVEVNPIGLVRSNDLEGLARAIVAAREIGGKKQDIPSWDGNEGDVWEQADCFWTVAFLEDDSVEIVQSCRKKKPHKEEVFWVVVDAKSATLPPGSSEKAAAEYLLQHL